MEFTLEKQDDVIVIIGCCPKCKKQKLPSKNSLIIMSSKILTPSISKMEFKCLVCETPFFTNMKTTPEQSMK